MKTIFFILLLFFVGINANCQELPNLSPSIKWQQIKSPHFRIIYAKGLEKQAQRITNILEHIYEPASQSLGVVPRQFPVILQHQYASSNGFVNVAPYRSELFLFEPQSYRSLGNDRWLEHLVVHEYRHMVQFEKAITPFNKFLYFLMGEYGPSLAAAASAPAWFFEGDAVGIETAMGRTGRGRIPSFLMGFKANLLEKGGFDYQKQYLKSFYEFVPNHYLTGYLMTTHLKNKYGADIMGKIVGRSFKTPFLPFSFSLAMKKETGKYLLDTYKEMMQDQVAFYEAQLDEIKPADYASINHQTNQSFTNYLYPVLLASGQIFAVKAGFLDTPKFVKIDANGEEEILLTLGLWNDSGRISMNDSTVVWTEQTFDPRWQRQTYSVIKKYNLLTKKTTRLTSKTRYSSPAISMDGKWVVAIHQNELSEFNIHLIDAQNGNLIKVFANDQNDFYSMPIFDASGENILILKQVDENKAIILKSIDDESERRYYLSNQENIGYPLLIDDLLYFASDKNGIDNIYAIDISDKTAYQVTNAKYGAFNPSVKGDSLLFNNYTANGYEIAQLWIDLYQWKVTNVTNSQIFPQRMIASEGKENILYHYPSTVYFSEKYKKGLRSFRPHSWLVYPVANRNEVSAMLYSKDLLSTTSISVGPTYNYNEKAWLINANVSYQAWYPIIDLSASVGRLARMEKFTDESQYLGVRSVRKYALGLRLPLTLTNSKYLRKLSFSSSINSFKHYDYHFPNVQNVTPITIEYYAMIYRVTFTRLLRRSKLDLNSRWGQTLLVDCKHGIISGTKNSRQFGIASNFYFPSICNHHSIHLSGGYQYDENPLYLSAIRFTRGYTYLSFAHYYNLSFNYKMPISYLDWHIGPLVNLQRIYTNLFFDYGKGMTGNNFEKFTSVGLEVHLNFNVARLLPLFDVGVRYGYLPYSNQKFAEILIGNITF